MMTGLLVDISSIRNGFRNVLAQQGLKPTSVKMCRRFDRACQRPEAGGHGGLAPVGACSSPL
jgi:hypothetical protein